MDIAIPNKGINRVRSRKPDFEELYCAVRKSEKKVYTDLQLKSLPDIGPESIEWETRKHSADRLLGHLSKKGKFLRILEVGCGNGWLTAKMADLPKTYVTGLDVNQAEINQASRVFRKTNLEFIYDAFNENTFDKQRFDVIVFAASLQYFPSVVAVLRQAEDILNRGGEIHIIDTPFYDPDAAAVATENCRRYYKEIGIPAMADHYFHHDISEFWGFNYKVMFNPTGLLNRLFKKDPFYWVMIEK